MGKGKNQGVGGKQKQGEHLEGCCSNRVGKDGGWTSQCVSLYSPSFPQIALLPLPEGQCLIKALLKLNNKHVFTLVPWPELELFNKKKKMSLNCLFTSSLIH